MTDLDMRHAPHCEQLLIVRTEGYSCTVWRCDSCHAIVTERRSTTPRTTNPKAKS